IGGTWVLSELRNANRLRRMLRVNGDIFLRSIGVQVGLAVFTATGARMGDVELAANAVLLNLSFFMVYGLDGFANAVEALAGEAMGAQDRARFHAAVVATTRWAVACAVLFSGAYVLFGSAIVDLMTTVPEVRATAGHYIGWVIAMPLVSVWCFHLDGVFIGATWTRAMRDTMAVSALVYVLSVLVTVPAFGNHGLWFSFSVFFAARGITLALRYPGLERRMEAS
ncbi:MAG: MATE family efflux transporter, partial [Rhodospirillaceae bacterium]